jgi:hypothetical protein
MGLLKDIFSEAMNALLKNRTRSLLTMLGIVWGRPQSLPGLDRPANRPEASAQARK